MEPVIMNSRYFLHCVGKCNIFLFTKNSSANSPKTFYDETQIKISKYVKHTIMSIRIPYTIPPISVLTKVYCMTKQAES